MYDICIEIETTYATRYTTIITAAEKSQLVALVRLLHADALALAMLGHHAALVRPLVFVRLAASVDDFVHACLLVALALNRCAYAAVAHLLRAASVEPGDGDRARRVAEAALDALLFARRLQVFARRRACRAADHEEAGNCTAA